jgi:tetratricopeptide (TPR) repeat protein
MKLYPSLIKLEPRNLSLRLRFSYLLDSKKQYQSAERELRKALELDPDSANANNNLAYLYSEQNRNLRRALALAQKAVRVEPNQGYIWDTLGWVHYRLKNYPDAENALLKVFDFERQSYDAAHYHLGMVYVRMKRLKEARQHFLEVPQLSEFYKATQAALKALDEGRPVPDEVKPIGDVTSAMRQGSPSRV